MAGNDNKQKQKPNEEKMVEEQIIPLEKYNLVHNWQLIMQFNFALFKNKDEFVIINNNDEYIARFSITDVGVIELKKTSSELPPKIDFKNKMIKIPIYYRVG
ncbi:hypothetical protein [Neobacillus vireti]|uniref:Uncharacterized protein n=1 Tax=Neobacillus vireti LMG 21834 TaxID=1131730 RepID=A0AB94ITZ3_9BACI|nr:hypothetical protein [Neobacillus vireti]ETI70423.1 hypothetical protein BAVI_02634 [Neobacillus vireti LMG 21834]KLT17814.1 hypothetical protein AA980_12015 [Neobacillus vireti]